MPELHDPTLSEMAGPEDNVRELQQDDEDVDLDLDALDDQLRRESLGEPTTVKIDGRVIHIMHAGDWSSSAMQSASLGNWDEWAREVIEDKDELQAWDDADLRNYQIEAIFRECGRQARMSAGKSMRRSPSRRNTRRK